MTEENYNYGSGQNQQGYQYQNQNPYGGYQQGGYQQGGYQQVNANQAPPFAKPGTNLVWAILTTILCCLPFGIVSIVFASRVDGLWYSGRYQEAKDSSRKAGIWAIVSASVALLGFIIYIILIMTAVAGGVSAGILEDLY